MCNFHWKFKSPKKQSSLHNRYLCTCIQRCTHTHIYICIYMSAQGNVQGTWVKSPWLADCHLDVLYRFWMSFIDSSAFWQIWMYTIDFERFDQGFHRFGGFWMEFSGLWKIWIKINRFYWMNFRRFWTKMAFTSFKRFDWFELVLEDFESFRIGSGRFSWF